MIGAALQGLSDGFIGLSEWLTNIADLIYPEGKHHKQ